MSEQDGARAFEEQLRTQLGVWVSEEYADLPREAVRGLLRQAMVRLISPSRAGERGPWWDALEAAQQERAEAFASALEMMVEFGAEELGAPTVAALLQAFEPAPSGAQAPSSAPPARGDGFMPHVPAGGPGSSQATSGRRSVTSGGYDAVRSSRVTSGASVGTSGRRSVTSGGHDAVRSSRVTSGGSVGTSYRYRSDSGDHAVASSRPTVASGEFAAVGSARTTSGPRMRSGPYLAAGVTGATSSGSSAATSRPLSAFRLSVPTSGAQEEEGDSGAHPAPFGGSGHRPTISGAFRAVDAPEHELPPDGLSLAGWPTSLDPWRADPPSALLWETEDGPTDADGTGPRLARLVQDAPIVGIELRSPGRRWVLWSVEGATVDVQATPMKGLPTLADLLVQQGVMDRAHSAEFVQRSRESGVRLSDLLVQEARIPSKTIRKFSRARLRGLLKMVLEEPLRDSRAIGLEFFPVPEQPAMLSVLSELTGVIRDRVAEMSTQQLREALEHRRPHFPTFRAPEGFPLRKLGLEEREQLLVDEILTGEHSLDRVLSMSPVNTSNTLAMIHTLDQLGMIQWVTRKVSDLWIESTREKLTHKRKDWANADPFTILATHWSAYDAAVERAWQDVRRKLDLERAMTCNTEDIRVLARALSEQLDAARAAVADRDAREKVRAKLLDPSRRAGAAMLSADQAKLAEFQNDLARARDGWRRVLELRPGDPEATKHLARLGHG